jgi:hypothetical protein
MSHPAPPAGGGSPGYHRYADVIGDILKTTTAPVDAAAESIFAGMPAHAEARLISYVTDRYVRAIQVPKDKQAKHGYGTRAAGKVASGHA